ncbi:hypothetical protein L6452_26841 [Arctium lappa]|uniref:Uncharacterized protein n=1 Tax=Arctium lappa TaxID=4217 RepID=A0ACB8ZVW1_ARCLA|nr:hypothetical protein L6452_26841 [Arctium lappa]
MDVVKLLDGVIYKISLQKKIDQSFSQVEEIQDKEDGAEDAYYRVCRSIGTCLTSRNDAEDMVFNVVQKHGDYIPMEELDGETSSNQGFNRDAKIIPLYFTWFSLLSHCIKTCFLATALSLEFDSEGFHSESHRLYAGGVLKKDFTRTRWNERNQNMCSNGVGAATEEVQFTGDGEQRWRVTFN